MNIEAELTRRVPAGAKLHTGRSRNDQVALDMRLWLRDEIVVLLGENRRLAARARVSSASRTPTSLIPGYTHLQRAQPVYLAHHLLAYVEMLERDCERLWDCLARVNVCPLGSGAIAGSTLPLDRELVAKLLGFVDAQGQAAAHAEFHGRRERPRFRRRILRRAALLAVHLSRLAEDVILWASAEFNFIKIADAYTTGSSLMPQKKNPDVAELTRGKTGRVIGNLVALLTLLKGLPMTYNRDLQEDKERLFDTADTVRASVRLMAAMLRTHQGEPGRVPGRRERSGAAGDRPRGLSRAQGHAVPAGASRRRRGRGAGGKAGKPLNQLTLAELQSVDKTFGRDALGVFDLKQAMARRKLTGAPGTKEVRKQLARWKKLTSRQSDDGHGASARRATGQFAEGGFALVLSHPARAAGEGACAHWAGLPARAHDGHHRRHRAGGSGAAAGGAASPARAHSGAARKRLGFWRPGAAAGVAR